MLKKTAPKKAAKNDVNLVVKIAAEILVSQLLYVEENPALTKMADFYLEKLISLSVTAAEKLIQEVERRK